MRASRSTPARRGTCIVVASVVAAFVAAACSSGDDDVASDGSAAATAGASTDATSGASTGGATTAAGTAPSSDGEPQRGGVIVIGVEAETDALDPANGNIAFPGRSIISLVMGSLTASDDEGNYVPYMAESVTPSADYMTWTIGLREGMTFHDGTPYDADAVKFTMDRAMFDSLSKGAWPFIERVDVVDPLTVTVALNIPMSQFPQVIADALGNIMSPAAVAQYGDTIGDHPIGAGPYMVTEYVRDDHITLEKFPDFWNPDRGFADTIIFRPIPDDAARVAALQAGDVDVISTGNPGDIKAFNEDGEYTVYERPNGADGLLFSVTNVPDIRIRQAVAMAVDKEALTELVFGGIGRVVDSPFPEDSFWHTDVGAPEYDVEGATALVEEVKAEGGDTEVHILSGIDETSTNYKLAVAEQMKAIGLDVVIDTAADANDQVNRYIEGQYDIYTAGVFAIVDPWFEYTRRFRSDSVLNGTGFADPELDAALETGAASADPDERKAAYDLVQQTLAENVVQIFVHEDSYAVIANPHIKGFGEGTNPDGSISWMNFFIPNIADEYWRDDVG